MAASSSLSVPGPSRPATAVHPRTHDPGISAQDAASHLQTQPVANLSTSPRDTQTHSESTDMAVTENPGIKPRNTNVMLKGRHYLLQCWMHAG